MAEREDVRWGQARRFELIEWRAYWLGRVNRSDLEEAFGVSTPQASLDLRAYREAAPDNIIYDSTEKFYVPTDTFTPKFLRLSADRYLAQINAIQNHTIDTTDTWFDSLPPAAVMPTIVRSVSPGVLRSILRAIEKRHEIEIQYGSLTKTRTRMIAPHSLAYDGHRWHARAWCPDHREFRDFVLTRIGKIGRSRASDADPTNDVAWNTYVDLKICAHPKLDPAQRATIENDYGMKDGVHLMRSRVALAFYLIRRLNLDLNDEQIAPARKQIVLTNLDEVNEVIRSADTATHARVADASTR